MRVYFVFERYLESPSGFRGEAPASRRHPAHRLLKVHFEELAASSDLKVKPLFVVESQAGFQLCHFVASVPLIILLNCSYFVPFVKLVDFCRLEAL